MRADVVDLSHWDDVQDGFAGTVRMGVLGVINKVTEGSGYVDPSFGWRRGQRRTLACATVHIISFAPVIRLHRQGSSLSTSATRQGYASPSTTRTPTSP